MEIRATWCDKLVEQKSALFFCLWVSQLLDHVVKKFFCRKEEAVLGRLLACSSRTFLMFCAHLINLNISSVCFPIRGYCKSTVWVSVFNSVKYFRASSEWFISICSLNFQYDCAYWFVFRKTQKAVLKRQRRKKIWRGENMALGYFVNVVIAHNLLKQTAHKGLYSLLYLY